MKSQLEWHHPDFPSVFRSSLDENAPARLYAMGETSLLRHSFLGMICSIQCPGSLIIQILDAARDLRDAGVAVIGGFHSPMEKECLEILLRGTQPVVLCPPRGIARLPIGPAGRRAIREKRMLVLSPFPETVRRATAQQAIRRNHLVAALAEALWVPHAAPSGKTWEIVQAARERNQPIYTFDDPANQPLLDAGARPFSEIWKKWEYFRRKVESRQRFT